MTKPSPYASPYYPAARAIRKAGRLAYLGGLNHAGSIFRDASAAMQALKVGDLVFEMSTAHYCNRHLDAVGVLLEMGEDPPGVGSDVGTRFWLIRTLDGRDQRWTNCEFLSMGPAKAFD